MNWHIASRSPAVTMTSLSSIASRSRCRLRLAARCHARRTSGRPGTGPGAAAHRHKARRARPAGGPARAASRSRCRSVRACGPAQVGPVRRLQGSQHGSTPSSHRHPPASAAIRSTAAAPAIDVAVSISVARPARQIHRPLDRVPQPPRRPVGPARPATAVRTKQIPGDNDTFDHLAAPALLRPAWAPEVNKVLTTVVRI